MKQIQQEKDMNLLTQLNYYSKNKQVILSLQKKHHMHLTSLLLRGHYSKSLLKIYRTFF